MPDATKPATMKQPDWRTHPGDWARWYVEVNPGIYRAFRSLVRARLARYPRARLSADAVLHTVRWNTPINARGDLFKVNNNVSALFARMYVHEFPEAVFNFELRRSLLDDIVNSDIQAMISIALTSEA